MKRIHLLTGAIILPGLAMAAILLTQPTKPVKLQLSAASKPASKTIVQQTTAPVVETPTVAPTVPTTITPVTAPATPTPPPTPTVYFSADSSQYPYGVVRMPKFTTDGNGFKVTESYNCTDNGTVIFTLTSGSSVNGPDISGEYVGLNGAILAAPQSPDCVWSVIVTSIS